MTDHTLSISAALREAQLQRLEATLASKSAAKPQPQVESSKDKDEPIRDGPLTVALQPLISTAY